MACHLQTTRAPKHPIDQFSYYYKNLISIYIHFELLMTRAFKNKRLNWLKLVFYFSINGIGTGENISPGGRFLSRLMNIHTKLATVQMGFKGKRAII